MGDNQKGSDDNTNIIKQKMGRMLFGLGAIALAGLGIATIVASGGAALPIVVGAILCCGGAAAGYLGKKITENMTDANPPGKAASSTKESTKPEKSESKAQDLQVSTEITTQQETNQTLSQQTQRDQSAEQGKSESQTQGQQVSTEITTHQPKKETSIAATQIVNQLRSRSFGHIKGSKSFSQSPTIDISRSVSSTQQNRSR